MPTHKPAEAEPINADSFLDIVASVVCIMLIMVLMIGMRIKNTPIEAAIGPEAARAGGELEGELATEQSLRGDVWKVAREIDDLEQETAYRGMQRDTLATMSAMLQNNINQRRERMDAQSQSQFDLAHSLADARRTLDDLHRAKNQADSAQPEAIVVQSYPTPISRAVDEHEAHFQLRGGCVSYIPLEPLIAKLKADAQRQIYKLKDDPEFSNTVGPEGGFRMKYTMQRKDLLPESAGRGGAYAELKQWTLVPVSNDLGEPADLAIADNSEFHRALAQYRPGRHTITIWLYADSFDAFRLIRRDLYRLGYAVAARPMPLEAPIGGSPEGSKSAAQ
jgi:hypothetical protein